MTLPRSSGQTLSSNISGILCLFSEEVNLKLVMEAPLLKALQEAPTLLAACNRAGVLTQLRAVSRTSRTLATSAVTTVTLQLGSTSQLDYFLPIMQANQLINLRLEVDSILYRLAGVSLEDSPALGMH